MHLFLLSWQKVHAFFFQTEDAMNAFDNNLTSSTADSLAPRIYVIGSLTENPTSILKIADFSYAINDPITAVDVMFKLHLSMNLKFPRQSLAVWAFINSFFYKLQLNISNSSQIVTITNEMTLFVNAHVTTN
jgi:hypothetical protein